MQLFFFQTKHLFNPNQTPDNLTHMCILVVDSPLSRPDSDSQGEVLRSKAAEVGTDRQRRTQDRRQSTAKQIGKKELESQAETNVRQSTDRQTKAQDRIAVDEIGTDKKDTRQSSEDTANGRWEPRSKTKKKIVQNSGKQSSTKEDIKCKVKG